MFFVWMTNCWLSADLFLEGVWTENHTGQQIPGDRNAELHFLILLLLKLLFALLMTPASIPTCAYKLTNDAGSSIPRVSWSRELLLCVGWAKTLDLGPSWLLWVPTGPELLRSMVFTAHRHPVSPRGARFSVLSISNQFLKNRVCRLCYFRGASGLPQHHQQVPHERAV